MTGAAGGANAIDVAFDELELELRLFPADGPSQPCLRVDDFCLRRRIGSGGMGSVYLAWSEVLQREVALKILHSTFDGSGQEARLLNEARCLARVKHPNIVQIHDVLTPAYWQVVRPAELDAPAPSGQASVIVMEYFESQTLASWMTTPRTWRAVVEVFLQVARGLVAAHRRGLLHSDLTPRNILIDGQGVARLVDFGLARPQEEATGREPQPPWAPVVVVHTICGTRGYAAPEQLQRGHRVDARSDLFGLCASLWQALCGALPYPTELLRTAPDSGVAPATALWTKGPAWLRELVLRGLALDPTRRPDSVAAFLHIVEARLARRARLARLGFPALTVALAAALGAVIFFSVVAGRPPPPFGDDDDGIEAVWTAPRRRALDAAMEEAPPGLRLAWPGLRDRIRHFAEAWEVVRARGRHIEVRGRPAFSAALVGLCLLDARTDFDRVLRSIEAALSDAGRPGSSPAWEQAVFGWSRELLPPIHCEDAQHIALRAQSVAALAAAGTRREALLLHEQGYSHLLERRLEHAEHAFRRSLAAAGDDPILRSRAHYRLALLGIERRRGGPAQAHLLEGLRLAESGGDSHLGLLHLKWLIYLTAAGDPGGALIGYALARGKLLRSEGAAKAVYSEEESDLHVQAAYAVAGLAESGRFASCPLECAAAERVSSACASDSTGPGPRDPAQTCAMSLLDRAMEVAPPSSGQPSVVQMTRAELARRWQDTEAAVRYASEAVALARRGTRDAALAYQSLGAALYQQGSVDAAGASYRRAYDAYVEVRAEDEPDAAVPALALARLALERGDTPTARDFGERARGVLERRRVPRELLGEAVDVHELLGSLYTDDPTTRDDVLGITRLRRGLELATLLPPGDSRARLVLRMHHALGWALIRRGALAAARATLEAGLRRTELPQHPELAAWLLSLRAEIELRLGDLARAREFLARSEAAYALDPASGIGIHHMWVRARLRGPDDPGARELAAAVAKALGEAPAMVDEILDPDAIRTWIAKSRPYDQRRSQHGR